MGVIVKPKNLKDRQVKRLGRIAESNPDRARTVASRISDRRDARGAENPQLAKDIAARRAMVKPVMKKGGKAKNGKEFGMLSVKAGIDKNPKPTAADRIAGAKGLAKSGKKVAKKMMKSGGTVSMQLGSYDRQIGKNYTGKNVVNKGAKAKMGKSIGKCKSGC